MDRDQLLAEFQFATIRGFAPAEARAVQLGGLRLSLDGPGLRIEVSHSDRDGFDCALVFSGDHDSSVSVGTLIAALTEGKDAIVLPEREGLREQARFLCTHMETLLALPAEVLEDCRALRFYHGDRWRMEWGRTIQMDAADIDAETQRVERLRNYFAGSGR